jgi:16S rRNA (cytidine1402-2'-O)-methyltransferase
MTLYIVATPIGNLEDITYRAVRTLSEVDAIYAENPRLSLRLLQHYDIKTPIFACSARTESKKIPELLERLKQGQSLAYISDAGTPAISDPAVRIVSAARLQNIPVVPIPGASAAITALSAAGLPTDAFYFYGFLPNKKGRQTAITEFKTIQSTIVLYESPYRIEKTCKQLLEFLGDRYVVIGRELTKKFEEFIGAKLSELDFSMLKMKGEFVLLVAPEGFKPRI